MRVTTWCGTITAGGHVVIRAGIFIGVDQTGGLTRLRDAAAGAERMRDWALTQGVTPRNAVLLGPGPARRVSARTIGA